MGYAAGLRACVQSLRRRHSDLPPILVLRPAGQELTLADVDEVIPFDSGPYRSIPRTSHYFGREVFFKLDVFNIRGYDRIVYLDCDTVVLDDISPLWDPALYADRPFYAVRERSEMGVHPSVFEKFNTGVMVINRSLLTGEAYRCLLDMARRGVTYDRGDQGVINAYVDQPGVPHAAGDLDACYNVFVQAKKVGQWELFRNRVKVLHFVNRLKPWAANHRYDWMFDEEFKRLWDEAYRFLPATGQEDRAWARVDAP
jgi:lipopolysaccharide biosynthesis glycosyltransferase